MLVYQRVLSTDKLGILQLTACHPIHPHNYINPCHEGFPSDWWMWDFNWSLATLSKLSKTLQDPWWKMLVWNIDGIVVTHCKLFDWNLPAASSLHPNNPTCRRWGAGGGSDTANFKVDDFLFPKLEHVCSLGVYHFWGKVSGFLCREGTKNVDRQEYWLELTRPNNFWSILGFPDAMFKGGFIWKLQMCQIFVYQENITLFF